MVGLLRSKTGVRPRKSAVLFRAAPAHLLETHLLQPTCRLKVTAGQIAVVVVSFTADGSGDLQIYEVPNPLDDL